MRLLTLFVLICFSCKVAGQQRPVDATSDHAQDRAKRINDGLNSRTHYLFKDMAAGHWGYVTLFPFAGDSVCVCHFNFFYPDSSAASKALAVKITQRVLDSLGVLFNIPELKKVSGSVAAYTLLNYDTLSTRFFMYPKFPMTKE